MGVTLSRSGSCGRRLLAGGLGLAAMLAACAPAAAPNPTSAPAGAESRSAAAPVEQPAQPVATQGAGPAPSKSEEPPASPAPKAGVDEQAVADFYMGKTIKLVVGFPPGGGYDTYTRVIGRHIGKHIPGHPTVIIENMPGAGSLIAANHVFKAAEKDGTVVAHIAGGLFLQQLLELPGIEFDAQQWQPLGAPVPYDNVCVATTKSGFTSLADAMGSSGKQLILGSTAPGAAFWDVPMRLKAALDLHLKMVEGYEGTNKITLAMENGEVDGMCGWGYDALRAIGWERVQRNEWAVLVQATEKPLPGLEHVPLALELAKTDDTRQLIRLGIMVPSRIERPFVVAPEVPAERAQALRRAFAATMQDGEFRAEAEKSKLALEPLSGEEVEQAIRDLFAMPAEIKQRLKEIGEKKA